MKYDITLDGRDPFILRAWATTERDFKLGFKKKCGIDGGERRTEHVQEPRFEGAPRCDVVRVILQEKVHVALEGAGQHEGFQVLSHLRGRAVASF